MNPDQGREAEPRSKTRRSGEEVAGTPYADLVAYFRNNFGEKIRLPATMRTFPDPPSVLDARNGQAVVWGP